MDNQSQPIRRVNIWQRLIPNLWQTPPEFPFVRFLPASHTSSLWFFIPDYHPKSFFSDEYKVPSCFNTKTRSSRQHPLNLIIPTSRQFLGRQLKPWRRTEKFHPPSLVLHLFPQLYFFLITQPKAVWAAFIHFTKILHKEERSWWSRPACVSPLLEEISSRRNKVKMLPPILRLFSKLWETSSHNSVKIKDEKSLLDLEICSVVILPKYQKRGRKPSCRSNAGTGFLEKWLMPQAC